MPAQIPAPVVARANTDRAMTMWATTTVRQDRVKMAKVARSSKAMPILAVAPLTVTHVEEKDAGSVV